MLTFLLTTTSVKLLELAFKMGRKRRSTQAIKYESIQTQRLELREAREGDLNDFHEIFSNHDVMRYWAWPTHTTIERTKRYLNEMMASTTNGIIEFVIVLPALRPLGSSSAATSKDKVIGVAGIWDEAVGEIGYMLHRDYWGLGYMSETLAALIPLFWRKGAEKLVADVDPRNGDSIKVLNKNGFVETGREKNTFESDLGWCDSVYLELWRPRRS